MTSGPVADIHVLAAIVALLAGAGVFFKRKGTLLHRRIGYAYIASMLVLNLSALLLYSRTGKFGPFHLAASISLATVIAGAAPAILRRPKLGWLPLHWEFMSWSYVGLFAGLVAESAIRLPGAPYWPVIVTASLATFVIGGVLIYRSRSSMRRIVRARQVAAPDP